ncbi:MAG: C40 family peptidase [Chlorobium sp.]
MSYKKPFLFSRYFHVKLSKTAISFSVIAGMLFGMSSCQSFQTGSGHNFESKYSLKKRKSYISCLEEKGWGTVIKPLPLKVYDRKLDRLFFSIAELLGVTYRSGGCGPEGFDCSGFVQYLYRQQFRMLLPRTTGELALLGNVVPIQQLRGGDLVFFSIDGINIDHIGIMIGRNRFAHAAKSGVRVNDLFDSYYQKRYAFGSRIVTAD